MLRHLTIKNYALIDHLELDFEKGFTVITGETGAGKSILLGAMDLILGKRIDSKSFQDVKEKCIVEGTFSIGDYHLKEFFRLKDLDYDDHTLIRREINTQGKSRGFVNDTPVSLNILQELGARLIDIHSQHQNLALSDSNFQISVLDSYAGILGEVSIYSQEFKRFVEMSKELIRLREAEEKLKTEMDYYKFLYDELEQLDIKEGEQESLEGELKILEHAEEIRTVLFQAGQSLENDRGGILREFSEILSSLSRISSLNPGLNEISNRFESIRIELNDLMQEIDRFEDQVRVDPERAGEINERLNRIYALQQKHRVNSVSGLISTLSDLNEKLNNIQDLESKISKTSEQITSLESSLAIKAEKISVNRKKAIPGMEKDMKLSVRQLGMPDADFKVGHQVLNQTGKDGIDSIEFLFNANPGRAMKTISSVASGGEKSRLMLAVKSLISKKGLLPTIIFDEIDTGVSGAVADRVGGILHAMASSMQVIAITHLPQIAGKGVHHFQAYKEILNNQTTTHIRKLTPDERIIEVAKLLSGQEVTSASVESARQLLNN